MSIDAQLPWQPGPARGNDPVERGEIECGDRLLVLVACRQSDRAQPRRRSPGEATQGRLYWDSHIIVATEMGWDDGDEDSWGAWDWTDVEWFIRLDKANLPPLD